MDELYSEKLLEAAQALPAAGRLEAPDGSGRRTSKVCGSELEVDLDLEGGVVRDFALRVKACALGQASASLLAAKLQGSSPAELRALRDVMEDMLRRDGPAPQGKFADLAVLEPIKAYPGRHASTLLVYNAVVDALDEAEARDAA